VCDPSGHSQSFSDEPLLKEIRGRGSSERRERTEGAQPRVQGKSGRALHEPREKQGFWRPCFVSFRPAKFPHADANSPNIFEMNLLHASSSHHMPSKVFFLGTAPVGDMQEPGEFLL